MQPNEWNESRDHRNDAERSIAQKLICFIENYKCLNSKLANVENSPLALRGVAGNSTARIETRS